MGLIRRISKSRNRATPISPSSSSLSTQASMSAKGGRYNYSKVQPLEIDHEDDDDDDYNNRYLVHKYADDEHTEIEEQQQQQQQQQQDEEQEQEHVELNSPNNPSGSLQEDKTGTLALTRTRADHCHLDNHGFYTCVFIIAMTLSSLTSVLPYLAMIQLIFDLTSRMFVCGPVAILQFVEKIVVWSILKRIHTHSNVNVNVNVSHDRNHSMSVISTSSTSMERKRRYSWKVPVFHITKTIEMDTDIDIDMEDSAGSSTTSPRSSSLSTLTSTSAAPSTAPSTSKSTYLHVHRTCSIWRIILFLFELCIVSIIAILYFRYIPTFCHQFALTFFSENGNGHQKQAYAYEWDKEGNGFERVGFLSKLCGGCYVLSVGFGLLALMYASCDNGNANGNGNANANGHVNGNICVANNGIARSRGRLVNPLRTICTTARTFMCNRIRTRTHTRTRTCNRWQTFWKRVHEFVDHHVNQWFHLIRRASFLALIMTSCVLAASALSGWTYLIDHSLPAGNNVGVHCDPIDTTECLLPFPSNFYTVDVDSSDSDIDSDSDSDGSSITGLKVNIEGKQCSIVA